MPRPRYEREQEWYAGPKVRRAVLIFYLIAAAIGLVAGTIWILWNAGRV